MDDLNRFAHRLAYANGLDHGAAHGLSGNDHSLAAMRRPEDHVRRNFKTAPFHLVLVFDEEHDADEDRDDHDDDPGPLGELDENLDDHHDGGDARSGAIDNCAATPVGSALNPPVTNHARLRKGEGREDADGV